MLIFSNIMLFISTYNTGHAPTYRHTDKTWAKQILDQFNSAKHVSVCVSKLIGIGNMYFVDDVVSAIQ